MNVFAIILIIIMGVCLWRGFARGLFRSILVAAAMVLSLVGAAYAAPTVSRWIQTHTHLNEQIESHIIESMQLDIHQEDAKTSQMQIIESLKLPEAMKLAIVNNNNDTVYAAFQVRNFQEYLAHYLAGVAVNALAFIVIQLIITIIVAVLIHIARDMTEIPILHGIDKTGGVILGAVQALAIIWSIFIFLAVIGDTALGNWAYVGICENPVLNYLYERNLLLDTITDITRVLL